MTFAPTDDIIFVTTYVSALFWSLLALDFPIRTLNGPKVVTGEIWAYVRAIVFPLFASITWYIMAALSIAAGNTGTGTLYYYYQMFFWVYLVVFFGMLLYLAFHPVVDVLQGRNKIED